MGSTSRDVQFELNVLYDALLFGVNKQHAPWFQTALQNYYNIFALEHMTRVRTK
jgi:hypothetical protein